MSDARVIAREADAALRAAKPIAPFTQVHPGFDNNAAYEAVARLRELREAQGARQVGRKIGFTNKNIWAQFGATAPIWGDMYDVSVQRIAEMKAPLSLRAFAEPLLEPEIVLHLSRAPTHDMDERALMDCVGGVANGFEIVQSVFPGWKFKSADSIAAGGLHGRLLLGETLAVTDANRDALFRDLSHFKIDLFRDDALADQGEAANVLGGPLSALRHLIAVLADDPHNPPLRAGELVTTGTLTRALPPAPGETWRTQLSGIAVRPIAVTFAG